MIVKDSVTEGSGCACCKDEVTALSKVIIKCATAGGNGTDLQSSMDLGHAEKSFV